MHNQTPDLNVQKIEIPIKGKQKGKTAEATFTASPGFKDWLDTENFSFLFNTYHIGKVFSVGMGKMNALSITNASFPRAMGMAYHEGTLWLSTMRQIWRFENILKPKQIVDEHDLVFVPFESKTIGDINSHDVRMNEKKDVFFTSCRFNSVNKLHQKWNFEPLWKPKHVSEFVPFDHCHMNCLALFDGEPKYVTCFSETDSPEGWRKAGKNPGVVIDVQSDEVVARGLSMPHSPQWYKDKLWVANSGTGEFGYIDFKTKSFVPTCFLGGFTRGVAFHKKWALVGVSRPRNAGEFEGNKDTELNRRLDAEGITAQCAVAIVNLETGEIDHKLTVDGHASEIYDVLALPGYSNPAIYDFDSPQTGNYLRPSKSRV